MNKKYFESFYLDFPKKSTIKLTKEGAFIETISIKCVPIESQNSLQKFAEQDNADESMIEDAHASVFVSALIFGCSVFAYVILWEFNHGWFFWLTS